MQKIVINGVETEIAEQQNLQVLLQAENRLTERIAVAVNGVMVPRSAYETHILHANDTVEVVVAIGGG